MTQDEIIDMARQAKLGFLLESGFMCHQEVKDFAKLVVEKVQDGNCKKCKDGCPACDARKLPNDLL